MANRQPRQDNPGIPEMETSPRDVGDDDRIQGGSDEEIRDVADDEEDFEEAEDLDEEEEEEDEGGM